MQLFYLAHALEQPLHIDFLWEGHAVQVARPEKLLHHLGGCVQEVLERGFTSLFVGGTSMIGCNAGKPAMEWRLPAESYQINLHFQQAIFNRHHNTQLWHVVDDVQAIENAVMIA